MLGEGGKSLPLSASEGQITDVILQWSLWGWVYYLTIPSVSALLQRQTSGTTVSLWIFPQTGHVASTRILYYNVTGTLQSAELFWLRNDWALAEHRRSKWALLSISRTAVKARYKTQMFGHRPKTIVFLSKSLHIWLRLHCIKIWLPG